MLRGVLGHALVGETRADAKVRLQSSGPEKYEAVFSETPVPTVDLIVLDVAPAKFDRFTC